MVAPLGPKGLSVARIGPRSRPGGGQCRSACATFAMLVNPAGSLLWRSALQFWTKRPLSLPQNKPLEVRVLFYLNIRLSCFLSCWCVTSAVALKRADLQCGTFSYNFTSVFSFMVSELACLGLLLRDDALL